MLRLDRIKTSRARDRDQTRARYTLSQQARDRLKAAAKYGGVTMSHLLELLIMSELPDVQAKEERRRERIKGDFL